MVINIQYLADIEPLEQKDYGAWIDCRAAERVELKAGDYAQIPLGFACRLPDHYEAHLAPRSSTFKNWGIIQTNGVGVIDPSFCSSDDQWAMPVYATRDTVIEKNDRICQFRVMKTQPGIQFSEHDLSKNKPRGGFGSTGKS